MPWTVYGVFDCLSFRVDENGLSISGKGHQEFRPSTNVLGFDKIETLPAWWTIYRAPRQPKKK
jgi:hypothetical protein